LFGFLWLGWVFVVVVDRWVGLALGGGLGQVSSISKWVELAFLICGWKWAWSSLNKSEGSQFQYAARESHFFVWPIHHFGLPGSKPRKVRPALTRRLSPGLSSM
jgi:hypothetical protein